MSKNQHVVKKDGDWTVKGAGNSKATKKIDTLKVSNLSEQRKGKSI